MTLTSPDPELLRERQNLIQFHSPGLRFRQSARYQHFLWDILSWIVCMQQYTLATSTLQICELLVHVRTPVHALCNAHTTDPPLIGTSSSPSGLLAISTTPLPAQESTFRYHPNGRDSETS